MAKTNNDLLTDLNQRYEDKFGCKPSAPRQEDYKLIVSTLENAINTNLPKIQVLCLPTGTGKTYVLSEYVKSCLGCTCVMDIELPNSILIVVRTTQQANELVEHVNEGLAKKVAVTCHSDNEVKNDTKVNIDELKDYQVAVITHAAYTNMLLEMQDSQSIDRLRTSYLYYMGCLRSAIVIDEKPKLFDLWICSERDLMLIRSYINDFMKMEFFAEVRLLDDVIETLVSVKEYKTCTFTEPASLKLDELSKKITKQNLDIDITGDRNRNAKRGINDKVRLVISLLKKLMSSQAIMQKKGDSFEIAAYVRLMPEDCKISTVVLDATASSDYSYKLIEDRVNLIKPDKSSRTYENLKLHVCKGRIVGKQELVDKFYKHVEYLQANLDKYISSDKKLLLICHKDNVIPIKGLKLRVGSSTSIVNWGNIDGKNEFKECNSVYIFGLSYLPDFALLIEVIALTGMNLIETSQVDVVTLDVKQLVSKLKHGYLASSIIQAMNRCQIRISLNSEGACLPTDIYLPLGNNKPETTFILESIRAQMPNVNVVDWQCICRTKSFRLGQKICQLLSYIMSCPTGVKHHLKELRERFGISSTTFDRFIANVKNNESDVARLFKGKGIVFDSVCNGRWPDQWLERVSDTLSSEVEHATI